MRKKVLRRTILLFLLVGIVFACMDDDGSFSRKDKLSPEIVEAKTWFESHADGLQLQLKVLGSDDVMLLTPDWRKAFSNRNGDCRVVEVHLNSEDNAHFADPECVEKFEETKDRNYLASNMRLIVRTDKKTGDTEGFIMVAYPDLSYATENKSISLKNISYLERDKDFSGSIYYYNMDGNFVNGWRYEDGTAYVVYPVDPEKPELRSTNCSTVYETTYYYTDWYVNGEYQESVYHGSNTTVVSSYCYETGNGGYAGDGGKGAPNTIVPRTDCPPSAKSNSNNAVNIMNNVNTDYQKVKPLIQDLRNFATIGTNEYGLAVNYANGQYYVYNYGTPNDPRYINSGIPNRVGIWATDQTVLTAHTHPRGSNPAPSPSDAIFLAKNYKEGHTNIKANVEIGADGSEYMVYIDDVSTLSAFCNNPNNSGFFEDNGAYFKSGSTWGTEYESAYNRMRAQGYSDNDAQSYALSYAIRNTGMKIYKYNEDGRFKEQKTELSGNNYTAKICP